MPTLAKLLDCLKWPKAAAGGTPVRPRGEVSPVSDPELTFGWQGNLFAAGFITDVQAAQVVTSVTIPDDCFYIIDATANYLSVGLAAAAIAHRRIALEIVDPKSVTVYSLVFTFLEAAFTVAGAVSTPPAEVYNLRLHLPQGAIVQWRLIDAMIAGDKTGASLSLRKLYEENM